MDKPILYAYDWSQERYEFLDDVLLVLCREEIPVNLDDYFGVILHSIPRAKDHSIDISGTKRFFARAKERNLPVFVATPTQALLEQLRGFVEDEGLEYDNLYFFKDYRNLDLKIREILND